MSGEHSKSKPEEVGKVTSPDKALDQKLEQEYGAFTNDNKSLLNKADVCEDVTDKDSVMVSSDEGDDGLDHRAGVYTKVKKEHLEEAERELQKITDDIITVNVPGDIYTSAQRKVNRKRDIKLIQPVAPNPAIGATYETKSGVKIHVFKGDITRLAVGAVVNAANCRLSHGGGVAGAISKAAGPKLQEECTRYIGANGELPTAGIFTSKAYEMPCWNVIHVVGPRWSDYKDKTLAIADLRKAFVAVLAEAGRLHLPCIAIPAVGSGIYGCPIPTVVQEMFECVKCFVSGSRGQSSLRDVILVDINTEILELLIQRYQQAVEKGSVKKMPSECERFTGQAQNKDAVRPLHIGQEVTERQSVNHRDITAEGSNTGNKAASIFAGLGSFFHAGLRMIGWVSNPESSPSRAPTSPRWSHNSTQYRTPRQQHKTIPEPKEEL